jgi:hypothetical protein
LRAIWINAKRSGERENCPHNQLDDVEVQISWVSFQIIEVRNLLLIRNELFLCLKSLFTTQRAVGVVCPFPKSLQKWLRDFEYHGGDDAGSDANL